MNIDAAIEKLEDSDNMSENMAFIVSVLDIDVKKLKEIRNASLSSQPHSSDSRLVLTTQLVCFYETKIATGGDKYFKYLEIRVYCIRISSNAIL